MKVSSTYRPQNQPLPQGNLAAAAPYTFSAKERDPETGLSYFGARYYTSDLSIWLSVDPMSAKYPSLSPYTYCANNPVKLVDPNGEEIGYVDEASKEKIKALTTKGSPDYSSAFTRKYNQLAKSKIVYHFREASQEEITSNRRGAVLQNNDGSIDIIYSEGGVRTTNAGGFSKKYATLFEETFHASEYDKNRLDLNAPTCYDEAKAWKFATLAPETQMRWIHSYRNTTYKDYTFAYAVRRSSIATISYIFKNGYQGFIDRNNNEHFFINGYNNTGLYNHLNYK